MSKEATKIALDHTNELLRMTDEGKINLPKAEYQKALGIKAHLEKELANGFNHETSD